MTITNKAPQSAATVGQQCNGGGAATVCSNDTTGAAKNQNVTPFAAGAIREVVGGNGHMDVALAPTAGEYADFSDMPNAFDEVERLIARQSSRLNIDAEFVAQCYPKADHGDALLLATLYRDKLVYDASEGAWYLWAGNYWQRDATNKTRLIIPTQIAPLYTQWAAQLDLRALE